MDEFEALVFDEVDVVLDGERGERGLSFPMHRRQPLLPVLRGAGLNQAPDLAEREIAVHKGVDNRLRDRVVVIMAPRSRDVVGDQRAIGRAEEPDQPRNVLSVWPVRIECRLLSAARAYEKRRPSHQCDAAPHRDPTEQHIIVRDHCHSSFIQRS